jgi:hypothetical protein
VRQDEVMKGWRYSNMLAQCRKCHTSRAVRHVIPERDDTTLDKIWNLKPRYVGVVVRREKEAA